MYSNENEIFIVSSQISSAASTLASMWLHSGSSGTGGSGSICLRDGIFIVPHKIYTCRDVIYWRIIVYLRNFLHNGHQVCLKWLQVRSDRELLMYLVMDVLSHVCFHTLDICRLSFCASCDEAQHTGNVRLSVCKIHVTKILGVSQIQMSFLNLRG